MGTKTTNTFTSFELTDKEFLEGSLLTTIQKQVLQNQRSMIAEEKLALEFNVNNPSEFTQQEAYKRGQLDIISYLLDSSEAAEEALVNNTKFKSTENLED